MSTISRSTTVYDYAHGRNVTLMAGTECPEWAEEQITNPKVLSSGSSAKQDDEPQDDEEGDLSEMTVPKLMGIARDEDVDLTGINRKSDIIQAIEESRAADD